MNIFLLSQNAAKIKCKNLQENKNSSVFRQLYFWLGMGLYYRIGVLLRFMKISCFSLKPVKVFVCLLLVCATLGVMLGVTSCESIYFGYQARKVPIYSVDTTEKKVALTFDAAWGADKTSKIIEILKEEDVSGTFFLVGFWSEKFADKIKEIDEAGLDIGTHSNTHPKMSTLSEEKMTEELEKSMELIKNVTNKDVKFFRPPYGDYNDQVVSCAEKLGLKTIQWDVDSLDWKGLSSDQILSRVKASVKCGSIILFHNNSDNILEALPNVIKYLKAEGYKMVKLSDLVYEDNYVIDNNGLQKKK